MEYLYIFDDYFYKDPLIITWANGLKIKCNSCHGVAESDTEPGDEDYIGEYYTTVRDVEVLHEGSDDSVKIYNYGEDNSIEICLLNIADKIELEDGTLLWERKPE
jgi:hypothetical protein